MQHFRGPAPDCAAGTAGLLPRTRHLQFCGRPRRHTAARPLPSRDLPPSLMGRWAALPSSPSSPPMNTLDGVGERGTSNTTNQLLDQRGRRAQRRVVSEQCGRPPPQMACSRMQPEVPHVPFSQTNRPTRTVSGRRAAVRQRHLNRSSESESRHTRTRGCRDFAEDAGQPLVSQSRS
jgi:hypothetical protein